MLRNFNQQNVEANLVGDISVDTVKISNKQSQYEETLMSFGDLMLGDKYLISDNVYLKVIPAASGNIEVLTKRISRGKNMDEALQFAHSIVHNTQIEGNRISYESILRIPEGAKWRDQRLELELKIPQGKYITFEDNPGRHAYLPFEDKSLRRSYYYKLKGKTFKMGTQGLICTNCPE